jgi:hypothetical protein
MLLCCLSDTRIRKLSAAIFKSCLCINLFTNDRKKASENDREKQVKEEEEGDEKVIKVMIITAL